MKPYALVDNLSLPSQIVEKQHNADVDKAPQDNKNPNLLGLLKFKQFILKCVSNEYKSAFATI